jgi:hypothetical protein
MSVNGKIGRADSAMPRAIPNRPATDPAAADTRCTTGALLGSPDHGRRASSSWAASRSPIFGSGRFDAFRKILCLALSGLHAGGPAATRADGRHSGTRRSSVLAGEMSIEIGRTAAFGAAPSVEIHGHDHAETIPSERPERSGALAGVGEDQMTGRRIDNVAVCLDVAHRMGPRIACHHEFPAIARPVRDRARRKWSRGIGPLLSTRLPPGQVTWTTRPRLAGLAASKSNVDNC